MVAILKKEIQSFFSSPVGYLVIGVFLIICGLFLFVFNGSYNILDNGFADLNPFFNLAPWIFVFLIPAITMKTFSEEKKQGTLELLLTKPIGFSGLILGKYFGALILAVLALTPSVLYVYTVFQLGSPTGNLDLGATLGSYIGLVLLAASYTAIGIFASSLSRNQITAFIIAVFLCFLCYYAFEGLAHYAIGLSSVYGLDYLGISYHYKSMSRGILDTRDVVYFVSLIILFLTATYLKISANKNIS